MANEFPFEISQCSRVSVYEKTICLLNLQDQNHVDFELVRAAGLDEITDGKFTLIGHDLSQMQEGSRHPYAMIYRVAGNL